MPSQSPPALVERQSVLDRLAAATADAAGGAGRVALVSGEAGIGKSAVVRAHLATLPRTARVLAGACDDLLTPGPFGPFHDVARAAGGAFAAAVATGDAAAVADAALDELATGRPAVLVVEDVHWADEATLDVLAMVGRRLGDRPGLLVLTFRADELTQHSLLRRLLGGLRSPVAVRIEVPPLSLAAVLELAGDRAIGLRLHSNTRGNPFLVTEMLAAGDLHGLPSSVSQAVLGRIARLPEASRELLNLLAVAPAGTDIALLDTVVPAWPDAAEHAEELGLVEVAGRTLRFRHELARRAVDEALPGSRRLQLDGVMLKALLAAPEPDVARVLHHAARSADVPVILRHGPAAARAAAAAGAHRQALDFWAQVLPHVDRLPPQERAAVHEDHAWEQYNAHRFDGAVASARAAVELRTGLGEPIAQAQALVTLSRQEYMRADMADALATADRAVRLADGDAKVSALARTYRGVLLVLVDREPEALPELTGARALAEETGAAHLVALCDNYLGLARLFLGEPGGVELLERSLADAARIGHREYRARAYTSLVKGLRRAGRFAEMARFVEEGLARTRESDFLAHGYTLEAHRHLIAAMRGDLAGAERGLAELEAAVPDAGVLGRETLPLRARLLVRLDSPEAPAALERAAALARRSGILQAGAPAAAAFAERAWLADEPLPDLVATVLGATERPGAERYRGELLRIRRRLGHPAEPFPGCPEEYALGLLGDWRAAAAAWERIGDVYEQALELADSGEVEPTVEGLRILDEIGAVPAARHARRRLRGLGVTRIPRGPAPATRANPAGLTERQVDVLRLLTEGFSNAEIAARLVLSPRTVDHHVSAILSQLGVASRREAARLAVELLDG